jgi:Protein of unknown function (DUF3349)
VGLGDRMSSIVAFLRTGYPKGLLATGYVPILALLRRRVSDDEILTITTKLIVPGRRSIDTADAGVEITRITDEMPSPDDVERVRRRLTAIGRPGDSADNPPMAGTTDQFG